MFRHQAILRAPEADPAGGGGDPKPIFTDEQLAAIGQTVNAAVTSHLKRQPALADQLKSLDWKAIIGPVVTELAPKAEPEPDPKGGKKPHTDDAVAKQLQDLAGKLEASEKRAAAAEQARADEANSRALDRAKADLRSALQPKVRHEGLDSLVKLLTDADKTVKLGEGGVPLMTVKRAPYKGAPEQDEDLPLAEAVPLWLASESAKFWLPAPGTGDPKKGSPAPRQSGSPGTGGQLPTDPAARTLAQFDAQGIDLSELLE
jgi:hypothetical protein